MLITNIGRLVTMESLGVIENAAIEIKDGKIAHIAPSPRPSPSRGEGEGGGQGVGVCQKKPPQK